MARCYGIVTSHSSTEHFLSASTVLHSNLRIESESKVPVGPQSSASSQTFSQPSDMASRATRDWEGQLENTESGNGNGNGNGNGKLGKVVRGQLSQATV